MEEMRGLEKLPAEKLQALYQAGLQEFATKPFAEASTDVITAQGGISKGLLFHYFGSKRAFYLYCLRRALDTLTAPPEEAQGDSFYDVLFDTLNAKLALCTAHMQETKLVNMASRDASKEIAADKTEILRTYTRQVQQRSACVMGQAVARLALKEEQRPLAQSGLMLYVSALINKYLLLYQERPEEFFKQSDAMRQEFRAYIDLMLKGIEKEAVT